MLIGPKDEKPEVVSGTRCHVKLCAINGGEYEKKELSNVKWTYNLLVRIVIAKVEDEKRLFRVLEQVPIVQNDPNWRCRHWVISAVDALSKDGRDVGTSVLDWDSIEHLARGYVSRKKGNDRFADSATLAGPRPTWDMLEGKETVP